jgi:hypothetical protein
MNYSIIQKISIVMVMIVSITFLVIKLFTNRIKANSIHLEMMSLMDENDELSKNEENYNHESDDDVDEINSYEKQEGFSNIIEGLDIGKEMRKTFEKPFNKMKDAIGGPLMEVFNFVNNIKRAFESIPKRAKAFRTAFDETGQGIKLQFDNLGESLKLGFDDVFDLIDTVGKCGIKTIENFRICVIWYMMDIVGTTLYNIIVALPIFITLTITGFNFQPYVDEVKKILDYIDSSFYYFTCNHLFRFPKWVIEACYTCDFKTKVVKIEDDWGKVIPALLRAPVSKFNDAGKSFKAVFSSLDDIDEYDRSH